jgi:hypothetical protein
VPCAKDEPASFVGPGIKSAPNCIQEAKLLTISVFGGKNSSEKYDLSDGIAAIFSVIFSMAAVADRVAAQHWILLVVAACETPAPMSTVGQSWFPTRMGL